MGVKIYELRDPRDESKSPRYVGITKRSLYKRLQEHLSKQELGDRKSYKVNWIKFLLKNNSRPTIHLIEEVEGWEYACKVEQYWIKEFKEQGYKLTNNTDGGEGAIGYKHSKEQCKILSDRAKSRKFSEETRKKLREARAKQIRGKATPKEADRLRKLTLGIKLSEEHKRKVSEANSIAITLFYDNKDVVSYPSYSKCHKALNIPMGSLCRYAKKGRCNKYKFNIIINGKHNYIISRTILENTRSVWIIF